MWPNYWPEPMIFGAEAKTFVRGGAVRVLQIFHGARFTQ